MTAYMRGDTVQAQILLITPVYYSQFPDRASSECCLPGVSRVFKDPNEPWGDAYARSGIVIYPQKYCALGETENGHRIEFQFLRNPHININDIVTISRGTVEHKDEYVNHTWHFGDIVENHTQKEQIEKFKHGKYGKSNDAGIVLHISHYQNIYMPGWGSSFNRKEDYRLFSSVMYRASLKPIEEILIANSKGESYLVENMTYRLSPGDIVKLCDNGQRIFQRLSPKDREI